jgi:hypothetical protein
MPFGQDAAEKQLALAVRELETVNESIGRHGLSLSRADIQALVIGRLDALEETERVEFGSGVAKDLVLAFAGSPFVAQATFTATIIELQELFYDFKNESLEQIPDEELIATMRFLFDDAANGDMGRFAEALFDGLGRHVREVAGPDDAASPDGDDALKNGYTLAAHRYDISKWVDDEFRPAWDAASWLDE